jgi:competence protein ComEC
MLSRAIWSWSQVTAKAVVVTVLVLAVSSSSASHAQTRPEFQVSTSVDSCLTVRARPDVRARARACLRPGTRVEGLRSAAYWRQIRRADGLVGWAAKRFLVLASSQPPSLRQDDLWLEVHVVDVGQGDGIWIQTADDGVPGNGRYEGRNIVIDGGPDAADARNAMLAYLQRRAHEGAVIDALIITHPHNDHYPGALGILRHFEVREYYDPGYPKEGQEYANFLGAVRRETFEGRPMQLRIGRSHFGTPDWGDELTAQFLYAYPGSPDGLGRGNTLENNASIVLRLEYDSISFLFMGDAEGKDREDSPETPQYAERILLDEVGPNGLKSTVLKIAHHGSETSSTIPFIEAVDPQVVVVASGRRKYGTRFLPDVTTLQRYCDHNPRIRIYRTDQDDEGEGRTTADDADGDHVILRTNGHVLLVEAYSSSTRISPTGCTP